MALEIKRLVIKVDPNGKVTYLTSSPIRQYEDKINVLYVWFDGIDLGETATVKLHAKNSEDQVLTEEQFLTPYVTTADETFVVTKNGVETSYLIPDNTKLYEYAYPQGLTTIPRNLVHSVVAYLADGTIFASEKFTRFIEETPEPIGDFEPDVIDTTLEEILASKTDVVDFNALRAGSLGFTLIDLDGHTLDWSDLIGTAQLEMLNGVVQDIGLEVFKYGRASGTIADGSPAQFVKYQGQRPIFKTPVASEVNDKPHTVRVLATQSFTNNQDGYLTRFGNVRDINTLGYLLPGENANDETTWGDTRLWFDPSTNGLTRTRPSSPNAKISMGYVTKFHSTQGIIDVDVVVYPKLSELQDVSVNGETNGSVLEYVDGVWQGSERLNDVETQADDLQDQIDAIVIGEGILLNEATDPTTAVEITRTGNFAWNSVNGSMTFNALNGAITLNSESFVSNATDSYAINTETLNINSDVGNINATTQLNLVSPDIQLSGNVTISGDLFVQGTGYETELETLLIKDNELVLRDGALTGLGSGEYAGFRFKLYDGTNDGLLVVGNDGYARVGDVGALQILATRQDSPTANGVAYWNNTDKKFDTNSNFKYFSDIGLMEVPNIEVSGSFRSQYGLINNAQEQNASVFTTANGTVITRNINDSNPALIVNEQQGTGDILRLQFGGATKSVVNKDGWLGVNKTTATLPLDVNGNAKITGDLEVTGDITFTKSAVDYTETYSNTISSTYGDIVPYKDGTPLITEISGRTMPVIPQLVTNGDFDSLTGWNTEVGTNVLSTEKYITAPYSLKSSASGGNAFVSNSSSLVINNKFYYSWNYYVSSYTSGSVFIQIGNVADVVSSPIVSAWTKRSGITIVTATPEIINIGILSATMTAYFDDYYVFNITNLISNKTYSPLYNKTFDLMSDAEIKLQMDEWVQTNQVPTTVVQHAENTQLKSTGKNLFDKGSYATSYAYKIKVKPSTAYVWGVSTLYKAYDNNLVEVSSGTATTITTPSTAYYIAFSGISNIETFQLEQGSTATAYAPYKSETQVFTHGRLSRLPNNVSDKIRYDNGKYVLDRYVQEYTLQASDINDIGNGSNSQGVYVQNPYTKLVGMNAAFNDSGIIISTTGHNTTIYNTADPSIYQNVIYLDASYLVFLFDLGTFANLAAARTALAGTKIYYQLATPLLATEVIDVDGTLVQDSVTTLEQTQTLATEYDVKFAINAEQTVVNLVDRDKLQQEVIDANEQKLEPITNSNGNVGIGTTSPSAKLHVAGSMKVDTGGTLLASGTGITTSSVTDLRTYKYIELRAGVVGRSSTKIPSSLFYYSVGGSEGINLTVSHYYSDLPTEHVEIPIRVNPANSSYTSIDVLTDTTSYDVSWEVYGWNY